MLISAFFCKKSAVFSKNSTFTYNKDEGCVRAFLVLFSVFLKQKFTVNENVSVTDHTSGIWLQNYSKLAINQKSDNEVANMTKFADITPLSFFLLYYFVSLVNFIYWSRIHINNLTGSGVIIIFVYNELTKNPEIANNLLCILPNI